MSTFSTAHQHSPRGFNVARIGGERCPPHYMLLSGDRTLAQLSEALGFPELGEVEVVEFDEVEVPRATRFSRRFSVVFGALLRMLLRYSTRNLSRQLLTKDVEMKLGAREAYAIEVNGARLRIPVSEAYCLIIIMEIFACEQAWDTDNRDCQSNPAYRIIQDRLIDAAREARSLMSSIETFRLPKRQSAHSPDAGPIMMWEIYAAIGSFFASMLGMLASIEPSELYESDAPACARCRNVFEDAQMYDVTINVEGGSLTRRFARCKRCESKFVGLTRTTYRQKHKRQLENAAGPSRPSKRKKPSSAEVLRLLKCRTEILDMLVELAGL